jgi:hypothetical protein
MRRALRTSQGALLAIILLALAGCGGSVTRSTSQPRATSAPTSDTTRPTSDTTRSSGEPTTDGNLTAEILHDSAWLRDHGITLVSWGSCGIQCSPPSKERVVVYHLTSPDVQLLDQRYGAENLELVDSSTASLNDLTPPVSKG